MPQNTENINIRPIRPADNPELAKIVRNTLVEFGAANPGTVYFDPTTDSLFELFQTPKAVYFVAESRGQNTGRRRNLSNRRFARKYL